MPTTNKNGITLLGKRHMLRKRKHNCSGKVKYQDKTTAIAGARSDPTQNVYRCQYGKHWHHGHGNKNL